MKKILPAFLLGTLLACVLGAAAAAAEMQDSIVGTWTLNVAKSKFTPGPGPKSMTRTYKQSAQGTALSFKGVAADGSPIVGASTFKYDGKDYAMTGSPNFDTLSLKRLNGSTVRATLKKGGKAVGTTVRSISGHGKVLTLESKGTDPQGRAFDEVAVYDKQ